MKTNLLKSVFVFLIAVSGFKAAAQDLSPVRHYFGVNYNKSMENINLRFSTQFLYGDFQSSQNWNNNFGLNYEYVIDYSSLRVRNSSLLARLNYYSSGEISFETPSAGTGVNISTNQTQTIIYQASNLLKYSVLNASLVWKKRFFQTPLYLSVGSSITYLPLSKAQVEFTLDERQRNEGVQFVQETEFEYSENNSRASINYNKLGDSQLEIGLQAGISVEFEVPNFFYNISNSSIENYIIIAPYGMITPSFSILKSTITDKPQPWSNRPWRTSPIQAGLDIRMPMPF